MTQKNEIVVDLAQPSTESDWICSMRAYHNAHGNYRQEDLVRLLGAPWQRVDIDLSADGVAASCVQD